MDLFDLIDNLKDPKFIEENSIINENLNSFVFPKDETNTLNDRKLDQIRESGMLPKMDKNIFEIIMNMGDPAHKIVGILIPLKVENIVEQ